MEIINKKIYKRVFTLLVLLYCFYTLFVEVDHYVLYEEDGYSYNVISNAPQTTIENLDFILSRYKYFENKARKKEITYFFFQRESIIYNRLYNISLANLFLGSRYDLSSQDSYDEEGNLKTRLWIGVSFYTYSDKFNNLQVNEPTISITFENGESALYFPNGWSKDKKQHWRPYKVVEGVNIHTTDKNWKPLFIEQIDKSKFQHIKWN